METILPLLSGGWSSSAPPNAERGGVHVHRGRLLRELERCGAAGVDAYRAAGGYALAEAVARADAPDRFLQELHLAGVRGRAGGGYPTAHKWYLVARRPEERKYFVCNAHARPGDLKVPYLLGLAPHALLEAVAVAGLLCGASEAVLAVPGGRPDLAAPLREALDAASGMLGSDAFGGGRALTVTIFEIPEAYIAGEESALLEAIEGKRPVPRGKPPLPTRSGLHGAPTAVSNLETVLQAFYALRVGADEYRSEGTEISPGTMVFTLQGDVARPGVYELPLGTSLRALVYEHGGPRGDVPKCVFPGGFSAPPVGGGALDLALDYDALTDAGSSLGSGAVIVVPADTGAPDLALELSDFFQRGSCGKCRPCRDGTERTTTMLSKLERLDEKSIDLSGRAVPTPKRRYALKIFGQKDPDAPSGISYTDMTSGLAKIVELCEFYKYRGDCHHSTEAASVIQRIIELFRPEFEARLAPAAAEQAMPANV
jgi:NADH-quinone oxidoreductase subunit F